MTTQKIVIRDETKADAGPITEVTVAAFATMEISSHTEQFIIEALRSARALTLSVVAEADGRVVGHIAFSPVAIQMALRIGMDLVHFQYFRNTSAGGSAKLCCREGCHG